MATSAEVRDSIRNRLILRAGIESAEGLANTLPEILEVALSNHSPSTEGDFSLLGTREHEAVLLLAWIEVCLTRASKLAPQPSLALRNNAPGFGADRDTPFTKNMKMVEALKKKYDDYCEKHGIGEYAEDEGDIEVGNLIREDERSPMKLPFTAAPALPTPSLSVSVEAGMVRLEWEAKYDDIFSEALVFMSSTSGIYAPWEQSHSSGIPRIATAAALVYRTDNIGIRAVQLSNVVGTVYLTLVLKNTNGTYTYGPEVTATVNA